MPLPSSHPRAHPHPPDLPSCGRPPTPPPITLPLVALAILTFLTSPQPTLAAPAEPLHWAFQPLTHPQPPRPLSVQTPTAIDAFLDASHPTNHSPPADRRTLIRRATYDLTGLPPTPEEVAAFLADPAPDAFHSLVERLLASSAYGERWGRKWLDLVRYADTAGENSDHPTPHAWRYRNWVIDAFNRDLPYHEFLRQQLAGDLLATQGPPERFAENIIATGFLAIARRFGHDIDQDMHLTYEDVLDTVGKSVLGLTLGCARCHDHKYDPVSMRDYYALYGILASTRFAFPGCEPKQQPRDLVPLLPPAPTQPPPNRPDAPAPPAETHADLAYAVTEGKPADARLQKRGDPEQAGETVLRRNLQLLGGQPLQHPDASGRLELAQWLIATNNPLTPRVIANRVWLGHFGVGLVSTPNDFGTRGAPPSHPELLDYLASSLIRHGWSLKALHREIMRSAAYQRASSPPNPDANPNPSADLGLASLSPTPPKPHFNYTTFPRRRLEAEEIRDSLLLVSGNLDRTPGGPHPFPPEKSWNFTQHTPFKAIYDSPRRSVYLMTQRIQRHPFLALFDGPDANSSTPRRDQSTVPTQALFFLNDPFFHAQSEALAHHLILIPDEPQRVHAAHQRCFQRPPTPDELESAHLFVTRYQKALAHQPPPNPELATWSAYSRSLLASSEFLHLD